MGDFPVHGLGPVPPALSSASLASGPGPLCLASAQFTQVIAWPLANLAIAFPFSVEERQVAYQLGWENGATVSGNVDAGIYSYGGSRMVSTGSTAQSGASAPQVVDVTDTVLDPGIYFAAMAMDNATGIVRSSALAARLARVCGVQEQATAFPLPASATWAVMTRAFIPLLGIALRPVM